jgi:zinc transporter ZupT
MEREKFAYPLATPPRVLGPLIILILAVVITAVILFAAMGRVQEAILACAAGGVLVLVAVIDMLSEVVRHQKLILEAIENKKPAAVDEQAHTEFLSH